MVLIREGTATLAFPLLNQIQLEMLMDVALWVARPVQIVRMSRFWSPPNAVGYFIMKKAEEIEEGFCCVCLLVEFEETLTVEEFVKLLPHLHSVILWM